MQVPFPVFRHRVMRLMRHPILPFVVGMALVLSSIIEILEPLLAHGEVDFGAEHGVLLYGLTIAVKATLELFEGLEKLGDAIPALAHERHEGPRPEPPKE